MQRQVARYLEAGLLAIGPTFLAIFLVFRIHGSVSSRGALETFAELEKLWLDSGWGFKAMQ